MPNVPETAYFLEPSDYSLLVARVSGLRRPVVIEDLREIPLSEKAQLEEVLRDISAGHPDARLAALRPAQRLHLANSDEARHYQTPAALQKFASESPKFSAEQHGWFAITQAREGSGAPWLLAAAAPPAHTQSLGPLGELAVKPENTFDAALFSAQAVAGALKLEPADVVALCLDLGAVTSHALLVTAGGIEALAPCAVTLDSIAEAVQAELALKFKGSAAKLFFNGLYDFSEVGSKIVERLEPALRASLAELGGKPTEFYCAGLPAKQQWLPAQMAAKLGLTLLQPDLRAWCAASQITFGNSSIEESLSPAWLGFLDFISVQCTTAGAWAAGWTSLDTPPPPALLPSPQAAAAAAPAKPAPAPVPVPAPVPAAKPTPPAPPPPPPVFLDPPVKAAPPPVIPAAPPPPAPAAAKAPPPPAILPEPPKKGPLPIPPPAKPAAAAPAPTPARPAAPAPAVKPTPVAPPPAPAPAPVPATLPAPAAAPAVAPVKPTPPATIPPAAPVAATPPAAKPAPAAPAKVPPPAPAKSGDLPAAAAPKPPTPAKAAPAKPGAPPAKGPVPAAPAAPATSVAKQPIVIQAKTTRPAQAAAPSAVRLPGAAAPTPKKNRTVLFIIVFVVVLLAGAGIFFFLQQQAESRRAALEKAHQEQLVRDQEEKQRQDQQRLADAAAAKQKAELENASRLAAAQAAQKKKG